MGIAQIPAPSGGLAVARFAATIGAPFQVPAGLTLQNTVTSTTTFSAGQLPAQVWAVIVGGGGSGGYSASATEGAGGGGGGGTCIGWVDVPSGGITATIGAGGAAPVSAADGNPGGNTTFGSYIAYGGGGGLRNTTSGQISSSSVLIAPRGTGGGYGGMVFGNTSASTIPLLKGAPFNDIVFISSWQQTTTSSLENTWVQSSPYRNNFAGGGMGGTNFGANSDYRIGANGHTAGGGNGLSSNGANGGNSSRDNGLTNSFTGGSGSAKCGGGGGAGFLANGSTTTTSAGGAGGSGGGGGGGGDRNTPGAGGNGCVLIYY